LTPEVILGVPIQVWRFDDAIDWMATVALQRDPMGPARVHFATVHSVVEAARDRRLAEVFRSATRVSPDGAPLAWVARRRGHPEAERVCGPDTMLALCDEGRHRGLRHYFIGGRPGVAEELGRRLEERYPGLQVVGTYAPPFGAADEAEERATRERIEAAAPDVLWVGLGAPKQEFWAAEHQALPVGLILPVGAAFDFHSGRLRRAPQLLQRLGLEWTFRMLMEPRRLAGRYVVTNTRFLYLLLRESLRRRRS
jgi:N-acetylglucosaminyldiphosphoundecaprenol N-acetyl-beta-D-mannosaminyltransferase